MIVYKLEVLVVDHEGVGAEQVCQAIENCDCSTSRIMSCVAMDVGEWHDDHALNKFETAEQEYQRLFNPVPEEKLDISVLNRVRNIIKFMMGDESVVITDEMTLDDFGFDSLDKTEFVMKVESEFDVTVEDEDVDELKNIGDVVEFIKRYEDL